MTMAPRALQQRDDAPRDLVVLLTGIPICRRKRIKIRKKNRKIKKRRKIKGRTKHRLKLRRK